MVFCYNKLDYESNKDWLEQVAKYPERTGLMNIGVKAVIHDLNNTFIKARSGSPSDFEKDCDGCGWITDRFYVLNEDFVVIINEEAYNFCYMYIACGKIIVVVTPSLDPDLYDDEDALINAAEASEEIYFEVFSC